MSKSELYEKYKNDPKGLEDHFVSEWYKPLGWQVHSGNCPELKTCLDAGHMGHQGQDKKTTYNIQHTRTGSDVTFWCTECQIYWKIDMSD